MRNLIYLTVTLLFSASCTSVKRSTVNSQPTKNPQATNPRFIEDISINPATSSTVVRNPAFSLAKPKRREEVTEAEIENVENLQFKYGILTNTPVELLSNNKLLLFLDDWYGTPYRYGGSTKAGIDCSAFVSFLFTDVYGISLPRNSSQQYQICKRINRDELQEGDLVFFKNKGRISHVGVYISNNKFAHASTSSGVMISDLDEAYFSRRFAASGRISN